MNDLKTAKCFAIASMLSGVVCVSFAIGLKNKDYFSVAGGLLTIFAIFSLAQAYFFLPNQSAGAISIPNNSVYRIAGGIGVFSGVFTVIGALPLVGEWLK